MSWSTYDKMHKTEGLACALQQKTQYHQHENEDMEGQKTHYIVIKNICLVMQEHGLKIKR